MVTIARTWDGCIAGSYMKVKVAMDADADAEAPLLTYKQSSNKYDTESTVDGCRLFPESQNVS